MIIPLDEASFKERFGLVQHSSSSRDLADPAYPANHEQYTSFPFLLLCWADQSTCPSIDCILDPRLPAVLAFHNQSSIVLSILLSLAFAISYCTRPDSPYKRCLTAMGLTILTRFDRMTRKQHHLVTNVKMSTQQRAAACIRWQPASQRATQRASASFSNS